MNADTAARPSPKTVVVRILCVIVGLGAWFGTQGLIAGRPFPTDGIGDRIFDLTAPASNYFWSNRDKADLLLILSSAVIDIVGVFLLASAIFGRSIRPFLGLLILFSLRQICQGLCALPPPPQMIWNDPGFPSLLVTYGTASDLFFSGHTSLAVYGALEIARGRGGMWKLVGLAIAIFEMTTVLLLRAHYTMDVYAGAVTALWVYCVIGGIAEKVDRKIAGTSVPR